MSREVVRDACDVKRGAGAWAVVMQEGLAHVAVLTGERTIMRQKVEMTVPKDRGKGGGHDKVCSISSQQDLDHTCEAR